MKQTYTTPAFRTIEIGIRSGVCNDFSGGSERLRRGAYGSDNNSMDD